MALVAAGDYKKLESLTASRPTGGFKSTNSAVGAHIKYETGSSTINNNSKSPPRREQQIVGDAAKRMNLKLNFLTEAPTRMKIGSNRKTGWMRRRRRSRSIDSSELLCDFSVRQTSVKLCGTHKRLSRTPASDHNGHDDNKTDTSNTQGSSTTKHSSRTPALPDYENCNPSNLPTSSERRTDSHRRRYNKLDVYEEAVMVTAIKGASCKNKNPTTVRDISRGTETPEIAQRRRFSLQRKCMSLNDLDYENVRLVDPSADAGIYEDPWNTEQTMEKLLSGIGLDGHPDDVRLYNTAPHIIKQSTFDSSSLQNSYRTSSLSKDIAMHNTARQIRVAENGATKTSSEPMFSVDTSLPLLQQCWYHDEITRQEAESLLIGEIAGAFLVRINSHQRKNLTLSVRTSLNIVHIVAQRQMDCKYILGQFSRPFDCAAEMIRYYSVNRLKIQNAPHTFLTKPIQCVDDVLTPTTPKHTAASPKPAA